MQLLPTDQTSSVTQKGQITIPVSLRKKLNLRPGAKVYFEAEADFVKIRPARSSLESVFGSVRPLKKKVSLKKMREIALEDKLNAIR